MAMLSKLKGMVSHRNRLFLLTPLVSANVSHYVAAVYIAVCPLHYPKIGVFVYKAQDWSYISKSFLWLSSSSMTSYPSIRPSSCCPACFPEHCLHQQIVPSSPRMCSTVMLRRYTLHRRIVPTKQRLYACLVSYIVARVCIARTWSVENQ